MTLCLAWIREAGDNEELVFATDSTLTGGEKWNHGVKLFELPRTDCLICFAGETQRAYPLILNLISTIKHNEDLKNPALDIQEVLYGIVELFNELVNSIFDYPASIAEGIGGEAKFLFGGWSWKENRFRIWHIYYSKEEKIFLYKEESDKEKSKICAFLGDPETPENSITKRAYDDYQLLLIDRDKIDKKLDLEPLNILINMCRDKSVREVDGALQIGKVYRSGTIEFFGVMWESVLGKPTFLGKDYDKHNKPRVRYFDPDTCQIIEDAIPKSLVNIEDFNGTADYDFLKSVYSQEDNFLKQDITDKERVRLISIFQEHSYTEFISKAEKNLNLETSATLESNG
ncbi:MAG: hypothetical protein ABR577_14970 [Pyrinomonadaceae bacterium]